MNNPETNTAAIPAMDSGRLSFFFCVFLSLVLANKRSSLIRVFIRSTNQTKHAVPPGQLQQVGQRLSRMDEFITGAVRFRAFDREIDHQGPAYDVGPRYKSPIAAVQTVVTVVAHHEVMVRGNYQFTAGYIPCQFVTPVAVNLARVALLVGKVVTISVRHP